MSIGEKPSLDELMHYGVKGMKWGVRRTQEQLNHHKTFKKSYGGTYTSDDTVFISGKVKFDEPLPDNIKQEINRAVEAKSNIVIGDAPGADTRVQDYLSSINYKNVTVYTTDDVVRNNVGNWKVEKISGNGKETEREVRRQKDIAMTNKSSKGIVISSDDDRADSATSLNVQRLLDSNKSIQFYDYKQDELRSNNKKEIEHSDFSSSHEKPSLDELMHYGTKMHSGRYPWGSGEDPYQHSSDWLSRVDELKKQGKSDKEIAKAWGMSTTQYRKEYSLAKDDRDFKEIERIKSLKEKGYSNYKIAEIMGYPNESTVRGKLKDSHQVKLKETQNTVNFLKEQMKEKKYIDVGSDTNRYLNISQEKLNTALYALEMEGYKVYPRHIQQKTMSGQNTTVKVLCPPGTELKDFLKEDPAVIKPLTEFTSHNDGETFHRRFEYPKSLDSKRLAIRYKEDGGAEADGIIELRRGVEDLSLGNSTYAQVRILVDDKKYLKGMAVYSDDMLEGVDVVFNTNKSKDVPKLEVLKDIKTDKHGNPEPNPFGSNIKDPDLGGQYWYKDKNGKEQMGLINKKSDEGDWSDWKDALPSQFLSKQNYSLAKRQLNLAKQEKIDEYNEICELTNPTVKKKLLNEFAQKCDSSAVHLQAASLPRQKYHVIIAMKDMKDNEVYAPGYEDGEKVALVRYPHGGLFEIPVLTVNNKHATAKKYFGKAEDAICINAKVAEQLSGADFDGDTVMVIPTNDKVKISSKKPLKELVGFDPKMEYATTKTDDGFYVNSSGKKVKIMSKGNKQTEMGKISNLITDMTLLGASDREIARAVKHSMVVIDAEKHKLDYKQSERDNDIKALREAYQKHYDPKTGEYKIGGASTLISRAKGQASTDKTQGSPRFNKKGADYYDPSKPEGALIYKPADDLYYPTFEKGKTPNMRGYRLADGKTKVFYDVEDKAAVDYYRPVKRVNKETGEVTFTNKDGKYQYEVSKRTKVTTKMANTDDAYTLVSDERHPKELLYADYANSMKSLANQARKEYIYTKDIKRSPSAAETYKAEVKSLNDKLDEALKNSPRERQAQILADSEIAAKIKDNPDLEKNKAELEKLNTQALQRYRAVVGAKRAKIEVTDREWEAIQAGAISKTSLESILNYADMKVIRAKAMPRTKTTLSTSQRSSLIAKYKSGNYSPQQLAKMYGVSVSTIHSIAKGKE